MLGFLVSETIVDQKGFYLHLVNKGLSEGTILRTKYRLKKVLRSKGAITQETTSEWIAELFEKGSPKTTINQYLKSLRHWCRYTNEDWITNFPFYKEEKTVPLTFSNKELKDFLALKPPRKANKEIFNQWTLFWTVCAYTGARTGEILSLKVTDVDFGKKCLIIQHTKTGEGRMIPLLPHVEQQLRSHIGKIETKYLFPRRSNQRGKIIDAPYTNSAYLLDFKMRLNRLGIKRPLTPYNFRHTAITRWLTDSKLNLFEVKRLVGHKKTSTTERYYSFGGYDKLIALMKTDPLVYSSLNRDEQFHLIKDAIKMVEVSDKHFEKEVRETDDEIILKIKKKKKNDRV